MYGGVFLLKLMFHGTIPLTIFAQQSVEMLEQCCNYSKQYPTMLQRSVALEIVIASRLL